MSEIDAATISLVINAVLGVLSIYLVKHMKKLRQVKDLAQYLIDAIDDHRIDAEETQMIIDKIKELTYNKEDEMDDILKQSETH
jgi:uncharacterized protein YoxC